MAGKGNVEPMPLDSPQRKRGSPDPEPALSLEAIRDVVRGEIQGAVTGVTDRVAALHGASPAEQPPRGACRDTRDIAHRLTFLEGTVKNLQSTGSTPSTADTGRVPALVMGGWSPDTPASEVLQKAKMARDLQLQLNLADAFVPGVRRGFVLSAPTPTRPTKQCASASSHVSEGLIRPMCLSVVSQMVIPPSCGLQLANR